jgi:hypothetical protein
MLSLVRPGDGALELYDGVIRVRDAATAPSFWTTRTRQDYLGT